MSVWEAPPTSPLHSKPSGIIAPFSPQEAPGGPDLSPRTMGRALRSSFVLKAAEGGRAPLRPPLPHLPLGCKQRWKGRWASRGPPQPHPCCPHSLLPPWETSRQDDAQGETKRPQRVPPLLPSSSLSLEMESRRWMLGGSQVVASPWRSKMDLTRGAGIYNLCPPPLAYDSHDHQVKECRSPIKLIFFF